MTDPQSAIDVLDVISLLGVIGPVTQQIEHYLWQHVEDESVLTLLHLAEAYTLCNLKQHLLAYVYRNPRVKDRKEWGDLGFDKLYG